ncbi:hypothetical protein TBR22_A04880 [Luteitalea sp. TBR-22]|uniref:phosphatase PAP2 family protein n=1 Tax=Luteitalea sp. TBR-22 TaxID=2802971 RepID=UPI001AF4451E|nr:phosphatase PAP2 family protein [Luteitalea sp. TBR-22]BCS31288.1 hypothetical protein TBR22_A04880 [Luteitalea sp. TBR-22]
MPPSSEYRLAWQLAAVQAAGLSLALLACARLGLRVDASSLAWPIVVMAAALGVAVVFVRRRPAGPLDWMVPDGLIAFALVVALCLTSVPMQYAGAALARPVIDPWLAAADRALGVHVPDLAAWTRAHPRVAAALAWAYGSFGLQILVAPPVLVLLGLRRALWEYVFLLHACLLATIACFAWFPAACAFQWYGFTSTLPQGDFIAQFAGFRSGALTLIDYRAVTGLVSAPSFHVAGALVVTWVVRERWWVLVPIALLNLALCAATVLSGAHYAVDVLLSIALFGVSVVAWQAYGSARRPVSFDVRA